MKKKLLFSVAVIISAAVLNDALMNKAHTFSSGPLPAHTGSPADGASCTACHTGGLTNNNYGALISHDIPASGYIQGQTYNITVLMSDATQTLDRMGFQCSPQTVAGAAVGTLSTGGSAELQIGTSGGREYINHTASGNTAASGSKFWTFQWTAPATNGPNSFTFYAACNFTNHSSSNQGDVIKTTTLLVNKNLGVGMDEDAFSDFSIFPNPATNVVNVSFKNSVSKGNVNILSLDGKLIKSQSIDATSTAVSLSTNDLSKGVYFVEINADGAKEVKKIIVE